MRTTIIEFLYVLSNIKWDIKCYLKLFFDMKFRKALSVNKRFKNLHKGERCFIVGNGPSLKKLDLTKISNEITFTVNNIMHDKYIYETINSDYHVFIDPLYYCLNTENIEDIEKIKLLKSINYHDKKPTCITLYEGYNALHKYGLDTCLDLIYVYQHKYLTGSFSGSIDLCRNMPSSQNVVHTAIFAAMYMGFTEIYLIGCDMTSIFLTFEANENGDKEITKDFHAYRYTESEMKTMMRDSSKYDNEYMLYDYAKTFTIFKNIQRYASKQNIKIENATVGGGLDVFSRIKYETIFKNDI